MPTDTERLNYIALHGRLIGRSSGLSVTYNEHSKQTGVWSSYHSHPERDLAYSLAFNHNDCLETLREIIDADMAEYRTLVHGCVE